MATTIIITPSTVANKYHITVTQLASATHCVVGDQHMVICESASQPGVEYKVIWNAEHGCMQCLPHNGPVCKASESGKGCWHRRAATAIIELEKAETHRERLAEQSACEREAAYDLEIKMAELERLQAELKAMQAIA